MYEPCILDDETIIGIILGHADTEAYLNRPKKDKRRKPKNHKVPQKTQSDCLPRASFSAIQLPEATKMKREMLRGPCLKACLVLSVFFSIAGIALVVVGTVMLTRSSSSSSSSSGGNHQWMLILGLLTVFVAIASYLCLRNYCTYHLGDAPVKVLSIEGEEMKGHQYQLVKKTEESSEKECIGETDQHLKECPEINIVSDGEEDEVLTVSGDIDRKETFTYEDEHRILRSSLHALFDEGIKPKLDVDFQRKIRRMSNIEISREDRRMSDVESSRNLRRKSDVEIQRELRRMSKVSQV